MIYCGNCNRPMEVCQCGAEPCGRTYRFDLVGGPLDGAKGFDWAWHTDKKGREGEASGIMMFNGVVYQARENGKAYFVEGVADAALMSMLAAGSY